MKQQKTKRSKMTNTFDPIPQIKDPRIRAQLLDTYEKRICFKCGKKDMVSSIANRYIPVQCFKCSLKKHV